MLALRKILQKTLAIIVSVSMVCTLSPASALAAEGDTVNETVDLSASGLVSASGAQDYANSAVSQDEGFEYIGFHDGEVAYQAVTAVHAYAYDFSFRFLHMTKDSVFSDPASAATSLQAEPVEAVFETISVPFNITWYIEEVSQKMDGTYEAVAGTDRVLNGPVSYNDSNPPIVNTDGQPVFTYGGFQASDFANDKTYKVSIKLATDEEEPRTARSSMLISINGNYKFMTLYGQTDKSFSSEGFFFSQLASLSSAELTDTPMSIDDPAYDALSSRAGTNSEAIGDATNLEITNIPGLDPNDPPYLFDLTMHVPIPTDKFETTPETVTVYRYDSSNGVREYKGTVVMAKDENGNQLTDEDGQPIRVAEFTISGGKSAVLGTFAVGWPSDGKMYSVRTSTTAGGTITPYGTQIRSIENTCEVSASAIAPGYELKRLEVKRGGSDLNVPIDLLATTVSTAKLTIDPVAMGIQPGNIITVHAVFEEATPEADTYTVTTTLTRPDGSTASGDVSFSSASGKGQQTTVEMGQTSSAMPMPSKDGVIFIFNTASDTIVDTVKIDGVEVPVSGTTFFLSALEQNIAVEVTYKIGDAVDQGKVKATATLSQDSKTEGVYFLDPLNPSSTTFQTVTYETSFGGNVSIEAHHPAGYELKSVVASLLKGDVSTDMTGSAQTTNEVDSVSIYNMTNDMKVVFTYEAHNSVLNVRVDGLGGSSPQAGAHYLDKDGDELQVKFVPETNYTLGTVKLDGNDVMDYMTTQADGSYTVTVRKGARNSNSPTTASNGDKLIYTNENEALLVATFDTTVLPAEEYFTVYTSVADTGNGSITPNQKVGKGESARVYFFPDDNYHLNKVYRNINGVETDVTASVVSDMYYEIAAVTSDEYIKVSFTNGPPSPPLPSPVHTITPSASAGGSISPEQATQVFNGQDQRFSFFASTGYKLSQVFIDNMPLESSSHAAGTLAGNTFTFTNVTSDHTISATFAKKDNSAESIYSLNIKQNGGGGRVSPAGTVVLPAGSSQNILLLPEANHVVDKVMVKEGDADARDVTSQVIDLEQDGNYACSKLTWRDIQQNTEIEVSFRFEEDAPGANDNLLITLKGSNFHGDSGSKLYPTFDGLTFPKANDGAALAHSADDAVFTIMVLPGYKYKEVKATYGGTPVPDGDLGIKDNGDGVYVLTIPAKYVTEDLNLTVSTELKDASTEKVNTWLVTLDSTGDGKISPSGTSNMVYVERGKTQTFYFIPDDGNRVKSVKVNGEDVDVANNGYQYKIENISQNMHIEAEFEPGEPVPPLPPKHTVNINSPVDGHGQLSPTGPVDIFEPGDLSVVLIPDAGYKSSVKVNGVDTPLNGATLELTNITDDITVTPEFTRIAEEKYHSLEVQAGNGGTASPLGTTIVAAGASQTITFIPEDAYTVREVWLTKKDESPQDVTADVVFTGTAGSGALGTPDATITYTVPAMDKDAIVEVKFDFAQPGEISGEDLKPTKKISIQVEGSGGTASPESVDAAEGSSVTVSLIPFEGYKVASVTVNGTALSAASYANGLFTVTADADKNVVIKFETDGQIEVQDFYTVNVTANQYGTVSPGGQITVPSGGRVAISFLPNPNCEFEKVEFTYTNGDSAATAKGPDDLTNNSTIVMNVTHDMIVHATFKERTEPGGAAVLTHTITASSSANGKISPSGEIQVADGASSVYSFIADDGYRLSYVKIDGVPIYASEFMNLQHIFSDVKEDHTIHAVFIGQSEADAEFHTINVNSSGNGTITPSGTVVVEDGEDLVFAITPFFGYKITGIMLDGQSITVDDDKSGVAGTTSYTWNKTKGELTIKGVARDMNLSAEFVKEDTGENPVATEYTTIKTVVTSTGDNAGSGGTNFGHGTTQTTIEVLPDGATLDISIIPDDDKFIDKLNVSYGTGDSLTAAANNAALFAAARTQGFITLNAADVNKGVYLQIEFRDREATDPIINYFEVSASSQGGGTISPTGVVKAAANSRPMFTFLPNAQFELSQVLVDSKPVNNLGGSSSRTYTFAALEDNHTILAMFQYVGQEAEKFTVTVNRDGEGGYASCDSMTVPSGESAILYFFPDQGKNVDTITIVVGDNDPIIRSGSTVYTIPAVTADTEVTVRFRDLEPDEVWPDLKPVEVTGTVGAGRGTISPESAQVPTGSGFKFYFYPDNGWLPDYAEFNGEKTTLAATDMSFNVTASGTEANQLAIGFRDASQEKGDVTVTAHVNVSATASASASVTIDGQVYNGAQCTVSPLSRTVPYGSPASFYIFPEYGWRIQKVLVDGWEQDFWAVYNIGDDYEVLEKQYDGSYAVVDNDQVTQMMRDRARQNSGTQSLAVYDFGATTSTAAYFGDPILHTVAAGENNTMYGTVFMTTIQSVTKDVTMDVIMEPIEDDEYNWVKTPAPIIRIESDGSGTIDPVGDIKLPIGGSLDLNIKEIGDGYLDALNINGENVAGLVQNGKVNIAVNKDAGGNLVLTVGGSVNIPLKNDGTDSIEAIFKHVGSGELVNVKMGTIKDADGNVLNVPGDVKIYTKGDDGEKIYYGLDSDGFLLDEQGSRVEFTKGASVPLFFEGKGPNGIPYVVDSATYAGAPITIGSDNQAFLEFAPNNMSGGPLNVVLKESEDPSHIDDGTTFEITIPNPSGKGTVTSSGSQLAGKDAVIAMAPYVEEDANGNVNPKGEHWIIDEVKDFYWDPDAKDGEGDWVPVGWSDNGVISPGDYRDGYYTIPGIDANHKVEVTFVEATYIDVVWNKAEGFVSPNAAPGDHLKVAKTENLTFFVGPYILPDRTAYDLLDFTVNDKAKDDEAAETYLASTEGIDESTAADMLGGMKVENISSGKGPLGLADYDPNAIPENSQSGQVRAMTRGALADCGVQPNTANTYYSAYMTPVSAKSTNLTTVRAIFDRKSPAPEMFTITASVKAGQGSVEPTTMEVEKGSNSKPFSFNAASGWKVGYIYVNDGPAISYGASSYVYQNVQSDGKIAVEFVRDNGDAVGGKNRLLRTLSSLAKTGDLNAPVFGGLGLIAVIALLVAGYSYHKRRKQNRSERASQGF